MIFCSKNEDGTPAWELVMLGRKTITRRMKPQPVGVIRAVQPNRGKHAVGYIQIDSCVPNTEWVKKVRPTNFILCIEADKEGFHTWEGLMDWFEKHKQDINDTYRIKFHIYTKVKEELG